MVEIMDSRWLVLGIVSLVLFGLFCRNRKKLGPKLMKSPGVTFAAVGIVLAWITGAGLMVHLEGDVNETSCFFVPCSLTYCPISCQFEGIPH